MLKMYTSLFVIVLLIFFIKLSLVFASTSSTINATIKISVCGNHIKEGGEDCDNTDFGGMDCRNYGYGSGILNCDISCSVDTSGCVLATPTPTLITTVTPHVTQPTSVVSQPVSSVSHTPEASNSPTPYFVKSIPFLPEPLRWYDLKGAGRIDMQELYTVVKLWVTEWRTGDSEASDHRDNKKCDIDNNSVCDMKDLSILFYYVGR